MLSRYASSLNPCASGRAQRAPAALRPAAIGRVGCAAGGVSYKRGSAKHILLPRCLGRRTSLAPYLAHSTRRLRTCCTTQPLPCPAFRAHSSQVAEVCKMLTNASLHGMTEGPVPSLCRRQSTRKEAAVPSGVECDAVAAHHRAGKRLAGGGLSRRCSARTSLRSGRRRSTLRWRGTDNSEAAKDLAAANARNLDHRCSHDAGEETRTVLGSVRGVGRTERPPHFFFSAFFRSFPRSQCKLRTTGATV